MLLAQQAGKVISQLAETIREVVAGSPADRQLSAPGEYWHGADLAGDEGY